MSDQIDTDSDGDSPSLAEDVIDTSRVWLDRRPGTAHKEATSEWTDEHAYQPNDGRSQTRTTFNPSDADGEYDKYERLARINDGQYAPERETKNREAFRRRYAQTFANELELTPYQTKRAVHIAERMDMTAFAAGHKSKEQVILGAISLVVDQDAPETREDWSMENWVIYRDEFKELMESLDMERSELWTIRRMLVQETEFFESDVQE